MKPASCPLVVASLLVFFLTSGSLLAQHYEKLNTFRLWEAMPYGLTKELQDSSSPDNKEKDKQKGANQKLRGFRVFVGYAWYDMSQFNAKLAREGNKTIDSGFNIGFEFVPLSLSKISIVGLKADVPLGIEYLDAASVTSHSNGFDLTVDWQLPVLGFFAAPEFRPFKGRDWFSIRPIGIGYYTVGKQIDARLILSNRPGRLEISGSTVGANSHVAFGLQRGPARLSLELDYRYLKFTNVTRTPKEGFTGVPGGPPVQASALPETLDYSGGGVKLTVLVNFGPEE